MNMATETGKPMVHYAACGGQQRQPIAARGWSQRVCGAELVCALGILAACSEQRSPIAANNAAAAHARAAAQGICERVAPSVEAIAGALGVQGERSKAVPGDPQSCVFGGAGPVSIVVSVRAGVGRNTVDTWLSGAMALKAQPLAAVGDSAAWQPELHELIAQSNDLLCDVQVNGLDLRAAMTPAVLQEELGSLCGAIFAIR